MNKQNFYKLTQRPQQQKRFVQTLLDNIPEIQQGKKSYCAEDVIPLVEAFWKKEYPDKQYKIFLFKKYGNFKPSFHSKITDDFFEPICIYYVKSQDNAHFYGVRDIANVFYKTWYCWGCLCPLNDDIKHRFSCTKRCRYCCRVGISFPCTKDSTPFSEFCTGCNKTFTNSSCYAHHLGRKLCNKSKQCVDCGVIYGVANSKANYKKHLSKQKNKRITTANNEEESGSDEIENEHREVEDYILNEKQGHVCGTSWCTRCNGLHAKTVQCFIQKYDIPKIPNYRIIVWDIESIQEEQVGPKKFEHEPNFIVAYVFCRDCMESGKWNISLAPGDCKACGEHRSFSWSQMFFEGTEFDQSMVTENVIGQFVKWFLGLSNEYENLLYAHNSGRYDGHFVIKELINEHHIIPKTIRQGLKYYEIKVKKSKKVCASSLRDSLNLFMMALDKLPKAFNLDVESKPFFPYLFNKKSNYNTTLPHLPPKEDYLCNQMFKAKRIEFDKFYDNANKEKSTFNLNNELAAYGWSDVWCLANAVVKIYQLFKKETKIDLLSTSLTISSGCMKHYRANNMKENTIASIPHNSYGKRERQSKLAFQMLSWFEHENGVTLQTALSPLGEKKIDEYKCDGYLERPGQKPLVVEVHGCLFHACEKCYPNDNDIIPLDKNKSAGEIRKLNKKRKTKIEETAELVEFYECEIKEELRINADMKAHFNSYLDRRPIVIRDAFFGGRTGPMKLLHTTQPGHKIRVVDFCSMYPAVTLNKFPVGHPKVANIPKEEVNWTKPEDNPYKGIIKCFVIPPRVCSVPVIPVRINKTLMFPLCHKCALMHCKKGGKAGSYTCTHSDEERGFVTTLASIELEAALKEKYIVTKVFHALHWDEWSDQIFFPYVKQFMEKKLCASGWPKGVDKDEFIRVNKEKFGFDIDGNLVSYNGDIRSFCKLLNNNLWVII